MSALPSVAPSPPPQPFTHAGKFDRHVEGEERVRKGLGGKKVKAPATREGERELVSFALQRVLQRGGGASAGQEAVRGAMNDAVRRGGVGQKR